MKVAIIGVFGAQNTLVRGPQRVAQELVRSLVTQDDLAVDLFELMVPDRITRRLFDIQTRNNEVGDLQVRCITPRALFRCIDSRYALVHFLGTLNLYTLPLLLQLSRKDIPTIATLNGLYKTEREMGFPYSWLDVWAESIGLSSVSRVVAVSESFRKKVEQVYPTCRAKSISIEHGVPQFAKPSTESTQESQGDFIFSAGGTRQVKGISFLLQALTAELSSREVPRFVLAGGTGDDHEFVMQSASHLGDKFKYVGELSTLMLSNFYRSCLVYIQPSKYESFGMAVLEAMAYAKPVIVTYESGVSSLIVDGKNGLLVKYGDLSGLIEKIRFVLSNPKEAEQIGKQARLTSQEYTWDRAARRYRDLYERVQTHSHSSSN